MSAATPERSRKFDEQLWQTHVDQAPTPAQVFRMATSGGAKTTAFSDTIGSLQAGRAADMVLIDWRALSYPYLDAETPLLDAVLQRAKTVRSVICDGEGHLS